MNLMAMALPLPLPLLLAAASVLLLPLPLASPAAPPPPTPPVAAANFSLHFFPGVAARGVAQLALSGGACATSSGAVSMPTPAAQVQYRDPIVFSSSAPGPAFSTYFSYAAPSLAFFLTPSASASASAPALAVVFSARHIRLDLAGRTVLQARSHPDHSPLRVRPPPPRHSWIDYNATSATLHVRLSPLPSPPLVSYPLDLSPVLGRGPVLAGFRASSGNCSLFSWAFRAGPYRMRMRMHSQPLNPADLLTTPPPHRARHARAWGWGWGWGWGPALSLLFAAACGAMLTLSVLFLWYSVAARRPVAPVEYPMHPYPSDVVYEKIVLVGLKDDDAATADDDAPSPSDAAPTTAK